MRANAPSCWAFVGAESAKSSNAAAYIAVELLRVPVPTVGHLRTAEIS
jgi:hypothetical protein